MNVVKETKKRPLLHYYKGKKLNIFVICSKNFLKDNQYIFDNIKNYIKDDFYFFVRSSWFNKLNRCLIFKTFLKNYDEEKFIFMANDENEVINFKNAGIKNVYLLPHNAWIKDYI